MNIRVAFDTHAFIKRLEAAGVSATQAEALADALGDIVLQSIATKSDLREMELSLGAEIKDLGVALRTEMNALELRMTTRLGVMIAASTTLTIAVLGALDIFS